MFTCSYLEIIAQDTVLYKLYVVRFPDHRAQEQTHSKCGYATLATSGQQQCTKNFREKAIFEEVDNSSGSSDSKVLLSNGYTLYLDGTG